MFSFFGKVFSRGGGEPPARQSGVIRVGATRGDGQQAQARPAPRQASQQQKKPPKQMRPETDGSRQGNAETDFGGVVFAAEELTSVDALSAVLFAKVINDDVHIGPHMYSRLAVAKLAENSKECVLFVDRVKAMPDEISAVGDLLKNSNYTIRRGHFASSSLIISLSQGHLTGKLLKEVRDIARDPAKNAIFTSFQDIIAWAYDNKADDIDFVLDRDAPSSQVAFKIGGRYIRPQRHLINTDTMMHMLGIAWQRSGGGSSATFDPRIEQQAQITMDLPKVEGTRTNGAKIRLRWSGMSNDKGTVVTMRLQRLGQSALVRSLDGAGYLDSHLKVFKRVTNSEGGMVCFSGVVGSGKSTSLAQVLNTLPHHVKIQSIEDPVELEIPMAYQKTVSRDLLSTGQDKAFLSAARAVYRSALDVLYLGEVRDTETGGIARQVAESGHTVYTTTHARSALGIVDRFVSPQIGIPRDVLGAPDILKLLVYQALLPVTCRHCCMSPSEYASRLESQIESKFNNPVAMDKLRKELKDHHIYWERISRIYGIDSNKFRMRDPDGCEHCIKPGLPELNGLNGRTIVCEMVEPDEEMARLILEGNSLALHQYWRSLSDGRFDSDNMTGKTAMECAIYKAALGEIDPREIEARFMSFETVEAKKNATRAAHGATTKALQLHRVVG